MRTSMRSSAENACIDALVDAAADCREVRMGLKHVPMIDIDSCDEAALEAAFMRADENAARVSFSAN